MGKKKGFSRVKQPRLQPAPATPPLGPQPPPPLSSIVDSVSNQADLDSKINNDGSRALFTFRSGNSKKALKMIRESISGHQDSPHLHCVEALINRDLADKAAKSSFKELKHLTNAIRSAEMASALSPNSIEFAFLLVTLLRRLAMFNGKEWDKVIEACERALKIENPVDMLKGKNPSDMSMGDFYDEKGFLLSKETRIEVTKQQILNYLEESQRQKNLKLNAKKAEDEEKEDKYRIKEDVMGLEKRKKHIESIIKELEHKKICHSEKFRENVEVVKYKIFWSSKLSSVEKMGFLRVNIEELDRHLKSLRNHFVVEVFAEALGFAKEHKTWKFLECCACLKKFGDLESYRSHLWELHLKNFESLMQSLPQEEIASEWIEMIVNVAWKPVDIYKASKIIFNKMKSEFVSIVDSSLDTEKGLGVCNESFAVEEGLQDLVGSESDGHVSSKTSMDDQKWPLSDDAERAEILERIRCIFLLLLRNRFLSPRHVHYAIQYTIQKFEGTISLSQFRCHGPETPKIICFLGASQLKELLSFLKDLVNTCGLGENSEMDISIGFNIKERVVFSGDFSSLLLDKRLLRGELTNATYFDAVADDGSAVTSAADVCEDDVLPGSNEIVSWLYFCHKIGEHLELWTRQRDSTKVKGKEVLGNILEECAHLQTAHSRISKLLIKMKAIQAIDSIWLEEIKNREQCPEHVAQVYVNLLRKRQKDLLENDDIESRTESDIIADVLKEALIALSSDQSRSKDCSIEDVFKQTDHCIKLALQKQKMQLLKDMAFFDAMILRRIDVLQKCELILEKLSLYDYRLIILPLLKSLLKTHLEGLFDKDAAEKSDATREALLAELDAEKYINKSCDNGKQKRDNKKKKYFRKAKKSKANYSIKHYQLIPQKDAGQDDDPNYEIGEIAEEMKQLTATEERLFEEHFEYQKKFEKEASLKVNVLGTGLINEEADSFVNVIIQSLWNLREFRELFISRSEIIHQHIGNPCVVCTLHDIFAALRIASTDNRGEAVAPTSLVIALRTGYHDKNIFQEGQVNDASELLQFLLESLHEPFGVVINNFESGNKYEGSLDCHSAGCFVHRIFGMDHYERIDCLHCHARSRHRKYTSLSLNINAYNLRKMKNKHGNSSFDALLKLSEMNGQVTCEGCGETNHNYHTLWCLPHVFTIVLGWQSANESSKDISTTLSALSTELDLSVLFQGYLEDNIYFLVSMVSFSEDRHHYICFIYNHKHEKYVLYDGTTVEVIGSWDDVLAICNTMHLQPRILFYLHKSSIYFGG